MPLLLLDARTVQPRRGGIGRMVEGLVRALARIAPGLEIVLVADRRGALDLAAAGPNVRERRVDAGTVDPRFEAELLPELVRDLRPDAYHATCFALPEAPLPCRTVATIHDACVRRRPELVRPGLRALLDRATEISLRAAGAVATVSEFSRGEIALAYGADPSRIEVIPNGVDASFFSPPAAWAGIRRTLALPERYWLVVGAEEERKGLRELIAGFALHARGRAADAAPLLLAGGRGGGERLDAAALAASAGVAESVRSLGFVAEDELRALYHGAAGVFELSRYEGFGLPVLEALAAGVPTVVASGSALPEAAGPAALIIAPESPGAVAEAFDRLAGDPALVARLRRAGPERARRFPWDAAARRYLALYGMQAGAG